MSASFLGKFGYTVGLTVWVVVAFLLGQVLAGLAFSLVSLGLNPAIETTALAALGYTLGIIIVIGVPALLFKKPVSKQSLGLARLPSWSDIGLGVLSILPYYLVSGGLLWLGVEVLKVIDPNVGQAIPFQNLSLQIEYVVAFITLVIFAPLAEELLFRGYFLGRLSEKTGKWVAVVVTALVFGLLHVPGVSDGGGFTLQWAAGADTFAMGLTAGILRQLSGSIWAGILLHGLKNGIAYYFLFVAPLSGGQ